MAFPSKTSKAGHAQSVSLTGGAVRSAQGSAIRVEGASLAVQAKGDAQLSGANVLDVRTGAAGDAVAVPFSATDALRCPATSSPTRKARWT